MKRVAIIGAGAAGLSAARHSLAAGHDVIIFEQTDQLGGTWVYRDEVGRDSNGQEVHTSMYKGLLTNLPKEIMNYPDVPFAEQPESYISSADVLAYLRTFADRFKLGPHIRYNTKVLRIRPAETANVATMTWEIIHHDVTDPIHRFDTQHFDAVFVCCGHNAIPKWPIYPGRHQFTGNLMHSHSYRSPEAFVGNDTQRAVLIIGSGPSGEDISMQIAAASTPGGTRVALSSRRTLHAGLARTLTTARVQLRGAVERFTGANEVIFANGEREVYTDVIFCTGYRKAFPFLSSDCGIWIEEKFNYIRSLFKECINIRHPTMFLPSMPFRGVPFQIFDLQVRFCLAFFDGHRQLPGRQEMLAISESDVRQRRENTTATSRDQQEQLFAELVELAGIEPIKPHVLRIYEVSSNLRAAQPNEYRHNRFRVLNDVEFERTLPQDNK